MVVAYPWCQTMSAPSIPSVAANQETQVGEGATSLHIQAVGNSPSSMEHYHRTDWMQTEFQEQSTAERKHHRTGREDSVDPLYHRPPNDNNASHRLLNDDHAQTCDCRDLMSEAVAQTGSHLPEQLRPSACGPGTCYSIAQSLQDIAKFTGSLPPIHSAPSTPEERRQQGITLPCWPRSRSVPAPDRRAGRWKDDETCLMGNKRRTKSEPTATTTQEDKRSALSLFDRCTDAGLYEEGSTWSTEVKRPVSPSAESSVRSAHATENDSHEVY